MTRKASRPTGSYREFEIHSGRRTVSTRYSSSALQAAIDHLRAFGSSADEITVLGPDTVAWRGARFSAVPVPAHELTQTCPTRRGRRTTSFLRSRASTEL